MSWSIRCVLILSYWMISCRQYERNNDDGVKVPGCSCGVSAITFIDHVISIFTGAGVLNSDTELPLNTVEQSLGRESALNGASASQSPQSQKGNQVIVSRTPNTLTKQQQQEISEQRRQRDDEKVFRLPEPQHSISANADPGQSEVVVLRQDSLKLDTDRVSYNTNKPWEADVLRSNLFDLFSDTESQSESVSLLEQESKVLPSTSPHQISQSQKNNVSYLQISTLLRATIYVIDLPKHVITEAVKTFYMSCGLSVYVISLQYASNDPTLYSQPQRKENTPFCQQVNKETALIWYNQSTAACVITNLILFCVYVYVIIKMLQLSRSTFRYLIRSRRADYWRRVDQDSQTITTRILNRLTLSSSSSLNKQVRKDD
jgi:hypothetical protein